MNESKTLGGKSKPFKWFYEDENIEILKIVNEAEIFIKFSYIEILSILLYIDKYGPLPLANNVSKLKNGTEKEGVGHFIYKQFGSDLSKAQSVSQLMPILIDLELIDYNKQLRNMMFHISDKDYLHKLIELPFGKVRNLPNSPREPSADNNIFKLKEIFIGIEKSLLEGSDYDEIGFKNEFDEFKKLEDKRIDTTDNEFYSMLVSVTFYSGFKASTVNKYLPKIKHYFNTYQDVTLYRDEKIDLILNDPAMLRNQSKVQACVKNSKVVNKIVIEYGSIKQYLESFNAVESIQGLDIMRKDMRKRFSYLGNITVYHLLTDLGYNVLKPDRVIMRIFNRLKLVNGLNDFTGAIRVGREIADITGLPIRYIDIILVSYGQLNHDNIMSICTEKNPKCNLCRIREFCDFGRVKFE